MRRTRRSRSASLMDCSSPARMILAATSTVRGVIAHVVDWLRARPSRAAVICWVSVGRGAVKVVHHKPAATSGNANRATDPTSVGSPRDAIVPVVRAITH